MTARMMSIFNDRWPEMSSFNIFIKTSHFDLFFWGGGVQTNNLCKSLKYSFSLQRLKYVHIDSTLCINKTEKHTHAVNMHRTHRYTHGILKQEKEYFCIDKKKGGILILTSRNICTVLLAKHIKIHSFKEHVFL